MSGSTTPEVFQFSSSGTIVTFIVPQTGTYDISAYGAQGGLADGGFNFETGGTGGEVGGAFFLSQGQTLEIAAGAAGSSGDAHPANGGGGGGGGGGASYVVLVNGSTDTVLEVAGGGGGGGGGGAGGADIGGTGSGGTSNGAPGGGGGGGGFYGNGADSGVSSTVTGPDGTQVYDPASGGSDFVTGLAGGSGAYSFIPPASTEQGGFGGFGGGGGGGAGIGGGGGGYTGGANGEGGTSFIDADAMDAILSAGLQSPLPTTSLSPSNGEVLIEYPACFAQGTRLSTPSGLVAVERLRVGDFVTSGRRDKALPICWVGHRHIDCRRYADREKVIPVRVLAGAFGPGRPVRDVLLSPDHAVFAEGILIPVRLLVNGRSVVRQHVDVVTYWHVEVDEHDVLLAEGLPVESYLDTGSRMAFGDGPVTRLAPDFASRTWEARGCAPLCVIGPQVDAVRARLSEWSEANWQLTSMLKQQA